MSTPSPDFVTTALGGLHLDSVGAGPPALLWHSLFVDSRSWGEVIDAFAAYRRVIAIDGPAHGRSERIDHDFTLDDCAAAAIEVLDRLGIDQPVDWIGNAWGGHVGIVVAATGPARVRTLTTIGTPVQALSTRERLTKVAPLVRMYRLAGATRYITRALSNALLGADAAAARPERAETIIDVFRTADRTSMLHAMQSVMVHRQGLGDLLPRITAPTLMLAARDDAMGWQLSDAQSAVSTMPDGRAEVVAGTGHVSPLVIDADVVVKTIVEFWTSVPEQ